MNLAYPAWLLIWTIIPVLAIAAVIISRFGKRPWEQFAAERLRGKLIKTEHPLPRWLALSFILASIAALAATLARPQGDAGTATQTTTGRNVMVAFDLSRSMHVTDVQPNRLSQAKLIAYELLEALPNDRIGLIGFAGSPFLLAPLTIDHAAVRETIEQMDPDWMPLGGSDIAAAVRLATETLKETGQKNNALILISDGEEHSGDLDTIIAEAERSGVTIFSIGVGTEDGGFVPHPDFPNGLVDRRGNPVLSRLMPDMIRKLANDTGGRYVIAGTGTDIPAMAQLTVQDMDAFEMEGGETRIVIEFFKWVLLPAIIFLMAAIVGGTKWRGLATKTAIFTLLATPLQNLHAASPAEAKKALQEERYDDARTTYNQLAEKSPTTTRTTRYRLAEGVAAYLAEDYRNARSAYSQALVSPDPEVVAKAHHGMGNTLFQLGWTGLSGESYPRGDSPPDMEKFDTLVREQLRLMAEADPPETGEANEFIRLDSIILNWADAVRHFQSALVKNPTEQSPKRNLDLTTRYLARLQELLNEEEQSTEQSMPEEGEPQPGENGEPGEPGDEPNEGDGEPSDQPGEGNEPGDEPENGSGDEDNENDNGSDGPETEPEQDTPEDGENGEAEDPNESPEDRARRKLEENSDLERGPLSPGRREFRRPEKDY